MLQNKSPLQSLQVGRWVKLICGASYQDMPTIRYLAMLYTLAGVDCIDVAADPAVIATAQRGVQDAAQVAFHLKAQGQEVTVGKPWLMVSLNDSEDPHFRKAYFDARHCPPTCPRPCEAVCPTLAIQFQGHTQGGVIRDLCYGCGRCLTLCPYDQIEAHFHQADLQSLTHGQQVDAIEIHTHVGQQVAFAQLWERILAGQPQLQAVSVSCPDGPELESYLRDLYEIMSPLQIPLIWQTDGRPMSGDLGKGATHAAIRLAQKVLKMDLPGYIQLAGGTNPYTVDKLIEFNLVGPDILMACAATQGDCGWCLPKGYIAGIAYGSYARQLIMPQLDAVDREIQAYLEDNGAVSLPRSRTSRNALDASSLVNAVATARKLVGKLKSIPTSTQS